MSVQTFRLLSVPAATAAIPGARQRFLFHFAALVGLFLAVPARGADGPGDTGKTAPDLFGLSA
jgi:hypothetical protein